MIQQVFCAGCGDGGRLPLSLTFEQVYKTCETCKHSDESRYAYHFCGVPCFLAWAKKQEGLPCSSCHRTGFAHGFKENGPCRPCGGTSVITKNEISYDAGQLESERQ